MMNYKGNHKYISIFYCHGDVKGKFYAITVEYPNKKLENYTITVKLKR